MMAKEVALTGAALAPFIDAHPFWVIWQVTQPSTGTRRIRRISQNYTSVERAEIDAERYRKSGAVTWVEEARPLAPLNVPAAAVDKLLGRGETESASALVSV